MTSQWESAGTFARRRRAENPGPMTLTGTNSYVLAAPGAVGRVVVDPGPDLAPHLAELAAGGGVELILITHHHGDHTDGSATLHKLTGAPVRAARQDFCHGAAPLHDGDIIEAAGLAITVLATPGHTSDSLCFAVSATSPGQRVSGPGSVVLTGDTILGSGSTVICHPDGSLADYMESLDMLRRWGREHGGDGELVAALPGHGPLLPDLAAAASAYQTHRSERIAQVRAAVELLEQAAGTFPSAHAVTAVVYPDVPEKLRGAAQLSVEAQLDYIRGGGTLGQ